MGNNETEAILGLISPDCKIEWSEAKVMASRLSSYDEADNLQKHLQKMLESISEVHYKQFGGFDNKFNYVQSIKTLTLVLGWRKFDFSSDEIIRG